jgi:L-asparaginase/Glu-tRNA(Gln) amidotransferase subunit D
MNLESEIYKLSFELSEKFEENELNKLLGVLASDGVYAMWVYAKDKFNKDQQKVEKINELIRDLNNFVDNKKDNKKDGENIDNKNIDNKYFQNLAQNVNRLLFMKELLEKVLIYAIYHAKAKGD